MCDQGGEFYNFSVKRLLASKNVHMYSVQNKIKAGIVERFNRTLKNLCYKNFNYISEWNFIDHLDRLVKKYNESYHRTIKMKPANVRLKHEKQLLATVYNFIKFKQKAKFKVGDYVRISDTTGTFRRGFQTQWSTAIYTIKKVQSTYPVTYKLEDSSLKSPLERSFYTEELQKVRYPTAYLIEKILKKNKARGIWCVDWDIQKTMIHMCTPEIFYHEKQRCKWNEQQKLNKNVQKCYPIAVCR